MWIRALCVASFILAGASSAQPLTPLRIMPLGDSITESRVGWNSYRFWLWNELVAAGYSVDFVGSRHGVRGGLPMHSGFDQDHEGHSSRFVDELVPSVNGWAQAAQPDIVLLHAGTNDIWFSHPHATTVMEIDQIVAALRTVNPNVVVLVAQLIAANDPPLDTQIPVFNALLPAWAAGTTTAASPVVIVDQFTGFDPALDTWDGVHPNVSGEKKMSERWLRALAPYLGGFKLAVSQETVTGDGLIRILAGPPASTCITGFTTDPQNTAFGFTGWFGGLHIPVAEVTNQYATGLEPFVTTLDGTGAGLFRIPAGLLTTMTGFTFHAATLTLGANAAPPAFTPPLSYTIQ